nr:BEN domain-containing protein 4-like [Aegilops tauschii subsp. strangulata]
MQCSRGSIAPSLASPRARNPLVAPAPLARRRSPSSSATGRTSAVTLRRPAPSRCSLARIGVPLRHAHPCSPFASLPASSAVDNGPAIPLAASPVCHPIAATPDGHRATPLPLPLRPPLPATPSASPAAAHLRSRSAGPAPATASAAAPRWPPPRLGLRSGASTPRRP